MAEDVPTEPQKPAEVRAFTDPDDVVRNIEARIASGRPISEPLPLVEPVEPAEKSKTEEAEDTDDFDAALSEAVAASISSSEADDKAAEGHAEDETDEGDDHAADVLKLGEFDPGIFAADTPDPQVTAAELLADPDDTVTPEDAEGPLAAVEASTPDVEVAPLAEAPEPTEAKAETATVEQPAQAEAEARPASPTGEAVAALAALPDEEAMRLLIGRMIRAELQGELGERITRNVRKLVRREIKSALASKDLS